MKNNVYQISSAKSQNKSKNHIDKRKVTIRIAALLGAALIFGTFCASLFLI